MNFSSRKYRYFTYPDLRSRVKRFKSEFDFYSVFRALNETVKVNIEADYDQFVFRRFSPVTLVMDDSHHPARPLGHSVTRLILSLPDEDYDNIYTFHKIMMICFNV